MIDKEEMKRLYLSDGLSLGEIARIYNVSRQYIHQEIKKMKIKRISFGKFKRDKHKDKAIELIKKGKSWEEIEKLLGVRYPTKERIPRYGSKDLKRCRWCGRILEKNKFYKMANGYFSIVCKECNAAYCKSNKEMYAKISEKGVAK